MNPAPPRAPEGSSPYRGDALTVARRVNHDLRSPLCAISTTVELLREILSKDSPGNEVLLELIDQSSGQMLALIEKTALVLRASHGEEPAWEKLNAGMVADTALGRMESRRRALGADFTAASEWPEFETVQDWFYHMWRQLLTNALEHGGRSIAVGWREIPDGYQFHVEDDGPGLQEGRENQVFPAFEDLHANHSSRGLGLATVRRLAELMGGRAGYERTGEGRTRFYFELPAARSVPISQPPDNVENTPALEVASEIGPILVESPAIDFAPISRQEILLGMGLLDDTPTPAIDTITSLVRRMFNAPFAFVSLIGDDRQFFKSAAAAEGPYQGQRETPLNESYCRHVVERDEPLMVTDASLDPLVCDNPSTRNFKIGSYLGVPLHAPSGVPLGSLCVMDHVARQWTEEQLNTLIDFSDLAQNELLLMREKQALADTLAHLDEGRSLNRMVMDNTGDCVVLLNRAGHVTEINRPGLELIELEDAAAISGHDWASLWPELYQPVAREAIDHAGMGRIARFQAFGPTLKGTPKWWDVSVTAIPGPAGTMDRLLAVSRDITPEKQAELAIMESEARLRKVLDALFAFVGLLTPDGLLLEANATALQAASLRPEDVVGKPFTEAYWWNYSAASRTRLEQSIATAAAGQPVRYEAKVRLAEHHFILIDFSLVPLFDEQGNVTHLVPSGVDLTARLNAEQALSDSEMRFRTLANNISQLAWMTDPDGWITWYNERWFEFTGTTLEEMRGWGWKTVHHPDHVDRVEAKFRENLASKESWEDTFPLRGGDGKYRWFLSRAVPVRDAAGAVVRWFGTNTDVTDQLDTQEALRRASQAKDDFIAVLSHELRTPLNPVLLIASEAVTREDLPLEVRQEFEIIRKNIEMEARLIDDLLDLTRINRGKLSLIVSTVTVNGLISESLANLRSEASVKGIQIRSGLEPRPTLLQGDDMRIRQVIWNVLRNAVKFTPSGGEVFLKTEQAGSVFRITVRDTGIGMSEDELERVFDPFVQGAHCAPETAHRFGGLGLGLAISKMLVDLHGGNIQAHSRGRDQGTTVIIDLPLDSTTPAAVEFDKAAEAAAVTGRLITERPMTILLVEDHDPTRLTLSVLLERRGHQVIQTATVAEAWKAAESGDFDLIMSDIGLPDGRGDALMVRLRAAGHTAPGIALSGYGMESDVQRSRDAGFAQHLTKPVSLQELDRALRRADRERR